MPRYSDEEYGALIRPEAGWSRQETDYLLDLCRAFELRFVAIADRYEVRCSGGGGPRAADRGGSGDVLRAALRFVATADRYEVRC